MRVTYWSDYACPFCYIGITRLKKAIANLRKDGTIVSGMPVELEMRAFELNPDAPKVPTGTTLDRFARKYGLTTDLAAKRIEHISELGRAEGIDFRYASTRHSNTFDAHRLTKFAATKGALHAEEIEERLMCAYFSQNLVLADHEVLVGIASEAGLDETEVRELLAGDAFAADVRNDENLAHGLGINSVPFFIFDGNIGIPGAAEVADFERVLGGVVANTIAASDDDAGMACGPDGCGPA